MVWMRLVDESGGLPAVHALRKIAVKEGVLDVKLVDWPSSCRGKMKNRADGAGLDHRGEGLMEVDPGTLRESADNPTRLAPFQRAVGMQFVLEEPFTCDDVSIGGTRDQCPCPVGLQRLELILHRRTPLRITKCRVNRWRGRRRCRGRGDVGILRIWYANAVTRTSDHVMPRRRGRSWWRCSCRGCRRRRRSSRWHRVLWRGRCWGSQTISRGRGLRWLRARRVRPRLSRS